MHCSVEFVGPMKGRCSWKCQNGTFIYVRLCEIVMLVFYAFMYYDEWGDLFATVYCHRFHDVKLDISTMIVCFSVLKNHFAISNYLL
jgi:hypothetical protein